MNSILNAPVLLGQITFNDIFKSSFLSTAVTSFSFVDVTLTMLLSVIIGALIYIVYKKSNNSVMYSRGFNISLIALTVVTSFVILAVTSNVVLSLGMVGALSIVRFRAAIKDPLDIVYLFWSIAVGIVLGAGLYILAIVGSILIAIILYLLSNKEISDNPYLLIVSFSRGEIEQEINQILRNKFKSYNIKSKTIKMDSSVELTIELRLKDQQTQFINDISKIQGVTNAVLVSYNGEFAI